MASAPIFIEWASRAPADCSPFHPLLPLAFKSRQARPPLARFWIVSAHPNLLLAFRLLLCASAVCECGGGGGDIDRCNDIIPRKYAWKCRWASVLSRTRQHWQKILIQSQHNKSSTIHFRFCQPFLIIFLSSARVGSSGRSQEGRKCFCIRKRKKLFLLSLKLEWNFFPTLCPRTPQAPLLYEPTTTTTAEREKRSAKKKSQELNNQYCHHHNSYFLRWGGAWWGRWKYEKVKRFLGGGGEGLSAQHSSPFFCSTDTINKSWTGEVEEGRKGLFLVPVIVAWYCWWRRAGV